MVSGLISGQSPVRTESEPSKPANASQHRTGRAVLHFLHHYLRIAFHQRNNLLARMAYNRSHLRNARSVRGINNPAHERLAQNLVCDLGLLRLHAGTGTRGQNDGGSFHGVPFSRLARKRELSRTAAPQAKPAAPQAIEPQKSIPQRPLTPRRLHAKRTQPLPKRYQRRNSGSERHARSATHPQRPASSSSAAKHPAASLKPPNAPLMPSRADRSRSLRPGRAASRGFRGHLRDRRSAAPRNPPRHHRPRARTPRPASARRAPAPTGT